MSFIAKFIPTPAPPVSVVGGSGITEVADWASRGTGEDGAWLRLLDTLALFRWSDDFGDWVRPVVYDGAPVFDAAITGTVVPSSETPTWNEPGSGTVSSDGTKVTFSAEEDEEAYASYEHNESGANHYAALKVQAANGATNKSRVIINTGARTIVVELRGEGNILSFASQAGDVEGVHTDDTMASEHELEIVVDTFWVWLYFDRSAEPYCTARRDSFGSSSTGYYSVGIQNTVGSSISVLVRNAAFWRY